MNERACGWDSKSKEKKSHDEIAAQKRKYGPQSANMKKNEKKKHIENIKWLRSNRNLSVHCIQNSQKGQKKNHICVDREYDRNGKFQCVRFVNRNSLIHTVLLHFVWFYCLTPCFLATLRTPIERTVVMNPVIYVTLSIKQPYNIPIRPIPMVSHRLFFCCCCYFQSSFMNLKKWFRVYLECMCQSARADLMKMTQFRFSPFNQNHFDLMYTLNNWPHRK